MNHLLSVPDLEKIGGMLAVFVGGIPVVALSRTLHSGSCSCIVI